ncbi:MAG TPA: hypothetical protein VI685_04450 [Candidatus Angelobacter sp.]
MKLIQILALVAALAVTAAAQSTSTNSQNSGSTSPTTTTGKTAAGKKASGKSGGTNQTPPVTLTVPKSNQATAGSKNSASTKSATVNGAATKTAASKTAAQTPASKTPAIVVKPVQPSTATTKTAKAKKTAPVTTKKSVAGKAVSPKKAVAAKKQDQVKVVPQKVADNKKAGSGAETIRSGPAGRRDPFLSIIRNAPSGPVGPSCSVGKKCLYIPELVVKGIAKDTDGQMLAVVVSNTHRAYFLRENDQVFNGSVEKITSDSVVFREYATDHVGRETAHEVVKRIPKT